MNISDYLYSYAVENLWDDPRSEMNAVFRTNRLTTAAGGIGMLSLPFLNVDLPTSARRYIVVELGFVPKSLIGIDVPFNGWITLHDFVEYYQTMTFVFSQGRMISLQDSYILLTEDGNILLAIDYASNQITCGLQADIYVRFYTNLYYVGNTPAADRRLSTGSYIKDGTGLTTYLSYVNTLNTLLSVTGRAPLIYWNGLFCPDGIPAYAALNPNDHLDYLSDPFIKLISPLALTDMDSYLSPNSNRKMVIASIDSLDNNTYIYDTEIYITGLTLSNQRLGVYFPRLSLDLIRTLTYKDLAIDSLQVDARLQELYHFSDVNVQLSDIKIYVLRRDNGEYKPTILDRNYLADLIDLPIPYRRQALSGINATLSVWNAEQLDSCPFNVWRSLLVNELSYEKLRGVYSRFGAINEYERVRLLPGNTDWCLPVIADGVGGVLLRHGSAGLGVTLTSYANTVAPHTTYTGGFGYEIFYPGQDNLTPLDTVVLANNTSHTSCPIGFDVFCYYNLNGQLTTALYNVDYLLEDSLAGSVIIWSPTITQYERYVRTSRNSVIFTRSITVADIQNGIDIYNGRAKMHEVGMGILSIWLNGGYLIEGLDYVVHDAKAYLISKTKYWTATSTVSVIYAGNPTPNLQHTPQRDWGWIKHGKLYNNGKYDLLVFRNRLFYIDGAAQDIRRLVFEELYVNETPTQNILSFTDGTPYAATRTPEFSRAEELNGYTQTKQEAIFQDAQITDYLTTIYPQPIETGLITIPSLYVLVSPIMDAVITALVNGTLIVPSGSYSNDSIYSLISSFNYLRPVDPCFMAMDTDFTVISPMWDDSKPSVTVAQFDFLTRVNVIVLHNNVHGLNLYLTITT